MPALPVRLIIDLTGRCNLRCRMCAPHASGGRRAVDMPMQVFRRLEPAVRAAREIILGGLGEPLLAANAEGKLSRLRRWNPRARIVLFTNGGTLVDPDVVARS